MKCIADVHYEVIHYQSGYQWGEIKGLACKFCNFMVLKSHTPKPRSSKSGLGRYNRMRGKMVKHLHENHRDILARAEAALEGKNCMIGIEIHFGDTEIFVMLSDGRISSGRRTFYQPNAASAALRCVEKLEGKGYLIRNQTAYRQLKTACKAAI